MKRSISVHVYIWKCWKLTSAQLRMVRHSFSPKWKSKVPVLPGSYDEYSLAIIKLFRVTEDMIERKNKFDRIAYDAEIKKLIEGIKNKYNKNK